MKNKQKISPQTKGFILLLIAFMILKSCIKITKEIEITLTLTEQSLNFSTTDKESKKFDIKSNDGWEVQANKPWITVSPIKGLKNGSITVTAEKNTDTEPREAEITVKSTVQGVPNKTLQVTQPGADQSSTPFLKVSPDFLEFKSSGEDRTLSIASNVMKWTVVRKASWLTVSPDTGSYNKTITVTAVANNELSQRFDTITVSGGEITQKIPVKQSGISVSLTVSPDSLIFTPQGGPKTVDITSNTAWTATKDNSVTWLKIEPASSSVSGKLTVTANPYTGTSEQRANITVRAGDSTRIVRVVQAGIYLSVDEFKIDFGPVGGKKTFKIDSNTGWKVSSNSNWLTVEPKDGSGNATITSEAQQNKDASVRKAIITITGGEKPHTIDVTQASASETLTVSKDDFNFESAGGTEPFTITSNTKWYIESSDEKWLFTNFKDGNGNSTIYLTTTKNNDYTPREGNIYVRSDGGGTNLTIKVTQKAAFNPNKYDNNVVAANSFGGGKGTQSDPYLINDVTQLKRLIERVNNKSDVDPYHIRLMIDIEVTADEWIPIGANVIGKSDIEFKGVFDGNGHTISGKLKSNRFSVFGFFGDINEATISNLTISATVINECKSASTNNAYYTGAIAGYGSTYSSAKSFSITNCTVISDVKGLNGSNTSSYIGGIIGHNGNRCTIQDCTVSGNIIIENGSWNSRIGGIVGINKGPIHTSLNIGNVSCIGDIGGKGGLAGENRSSSDEAHIYNCCAHRGTVTVKTGDVVHNINSNVIGTGRDVETCPDKHKQR